MFFRKWANFFFLLLTHFVGAFLNVNVLLIWRRDFVTHLSMTAEGEKKVWEVIVAISMTLISKIGNNFFQKQQKRQNRNQPEWNSSNLSVTIIYINRIESWSPSSPSTWNWWKQNNNPLLQFQFDFNTVESVTNQRLLNAWLFNNSFNASTMLNRYDLTV